GFAFTGEQRDDNALQYHRARYYAPGLGVWTQQDLFEGMHDKAMSLNGYSWVEGQVVNATDASGKNPNSFDTCKCICQFQGDWDFLACLGDCHRYGLSKVNIGPANCQVDLTAKTATNCIYNRER